jgi:hypothetical protein
MCPSRESKIQSVSYVDNFLSFAIVLDTRVYVYNLADLRLIDAMDTC